MKVKYKNKFKNKFLGPVLVLVFLISIGYAAFNLTYRVRGDLRFKSLSWDVAFDPESVEVTEGSVSVDTNKGETGATISDGTLVNFNVSLGKPGDFYEFTADLVNEGNTKAILSEIKIIPDPNNEMPECFIYTITYDNGDEIKVGDELEGLGSVKVRVKVEYDLDITPDQLIKDDLDNLNFSFKLIYVQDAPGVTV